MNIVLLIHPEFLGIQSQNRFAEMLQREYTLRGHRVELRRPRERWHALAPKRFAKWGGYVDQYLSFPAELRRAAAADSDDTVYVFCDQALGPWIPHLAHRPHVVHCHDLIALRSALGEFDEHETGWSGRAYQRYIRRGFRRARHFISVSRATRDELHRIGGVAPITSEVVHNGQHRAFRRIARGVVVDRLRAAGLPDDAPAILHVGGGQWYKNPLGVARIYRAYAHAALRSGARPLPLWMVSPPADAPLADALSGLPAPAMVRFLSGIDADLLEALYCNASVLLFPSIAEGFGWPIVEAMACGCSVVTTDAAPMNEIGGDAISYVPRLRREADVAAWAEAGAAIVLEFARRSPAQRDETAEPLVQRAAAFSADAAIEGYLAIYRTVLERELATARSRAEAATAVRA